MPEPMDWRDLHEPLVDALTGPDVLAQHGARGSFQTAEGLQRFASQVGDAYAEALQKAGAPNEAIRQLRPAVEEHATRRGQFHGLTQKWGQWATDPNFLGGAPPEFNERGQRIYRVATDHHLLGTSDDGTTFLNSRPGVATGDPLVREYARRHANAYAEDLKNVPGLSEEERQASRQAMEDYTFHQARAATLAAYAKDAGNRGFGGVQEAVTHLPFARSGWGLLRDGIGNER
jgi:hypothetical protein